MNYEEVIESEVQGILHNNSAKMLYIREDKTRYTGPGNLCMLLAIHFGKMLREDRIKFLRYVFDRQSINSMKDLTIAEGEALLKHSDLLDLLIQKWKQYGL